MSLIRPSEYLSSLGSRQSADAQLLRRLWTSLGSSIAISISAAGAWFLIASSATTEPIPVTLLDRSQPATIAAPFDTIVLSIRVRNGDRVEVNDPLIDIDTSVLKRELEVAQHSIEGLAIRRQRLTAELVGHTGFEIGAAQQAPGLNHIVQAERLLLESRRGSAAQRTDAARERLFEARTRVEQLRSLVASSDRILGNHQNELIAIQDMVARQQLPVSQLVSTRANARAFQEEHLVLVERLRVAESQAMDANEAIRRLGDEHRNAINDEIESVDRRVTELMAATARFRAMEATGTLRATHRGTVKLEQALTAGTTAAADKPLITLSAVAEPMIEVAMTADGTNLLPGQSIRLHLNSEGPKAPARSGQVISVGPGTGDTGSTRTQTARLRLADEISPSKDDVDRSGVLTIGTPRSNIPTVSSIMDRLKAFIFR